MMNNGRILYFSVMDKNLYTSDWINLDGNHVHKSAIVHPNVKMGKGNWIGAFCVIGGNGEMRGVNQDDFKGHVEIGDKNIISEFVSIQRPYEKGRSTKIGDNNIIMRGSHLGHDTKVGNGCEICTGVILGGYSVIEDGVKLKLGVIVRNRVTIGIGAIIGMGSIVTKDVPAGEVWYGSPAKKSEK